MVLWPEGEYDLIKFFCKDKALFPALFKEIILCYDVKCIYYAVIEVCGLSFSEWCFNDDAR